MLGKIEGRRRGQQRMRWLDCITDSMMNLSKLGKDVSGDTEGQRNLVCCSPWGCKESDTTDQLNNNSPKLARRRGKNGSEAGKERG